MDIDDFAKMVIDKAKEAMIKGDKEESIRLLNLLIDTLVDKVREIRKME